MKSHAAYPKDKPLVFQFTMETARILLALVFCFSGFVKAVDPLGTAYKIEDFLEAFSLMPLSAWALPLSLLLSTLEFVVGVALLFRLKYRPAAWAALLLMLVFTPFTLYVAMADPVPDCGCFGDAIHLSNWQTFFKNLALLACAILVYLRREMPSPRWMAHRSAFMLVIATACILGLSAYSLNNLPIIDFRPWRVGNVISEQMQDIRPPVIERFFVYQDRETGETISLSELEIMEKGAPDAAQWRFVQRKEVVHDPGVPSPIQAFAIYDEAGQEVTDFYIENPDYQMLVIAYDLASTRTAAFRERISPLAREAEDKGISLIVLTGSSFEDIEAFRQAHQLFYPFYQADERELKTIIRSNPGLILMKDGVVQAKWAHRNIPVVAH